MDVHSRAVPVPIIGISFYKHRPIGAVVRTAVIAFWTSVACLGSTHSAAADPVQLWTVYETARLGETGSDTPVGSGTISSNQFVGARFQVTEPVSVMRVGGHFGGNEPGDIFAALVALSGPADFPNSFELSTGDVLGVSIIGMGTDWPSFFLPSREFSTELPVDLAPGWYALVVGSGLFGASGIAGLLGTDDPIRPRSMFFSNNAGPVWVNTEFAGGRLFVDAAVPEPGTMLLAASGLAGILWRRRRVSTTRNKSSHLLS